MKMCRGAWVLGRMGGVVFKDFKDIGEKPDKIEFLAIFLHFLGKNHKGCMESFKMSGKRNVRDLNVYQVSFQAALEIFVVTKEFPAEEKYSLVDQMRRSSRSVCANLAEAWRKRRYRAAFIAKLSDAESEAAETLVWLEIARSCEYLVESEFDRLSDAFDHIIAQIVRMIATADHWVISG